MVGNGWIVAQEHGQFSMSGELCGVRSNPAVLVICSMPEVYCSQHGKESRSPRLGIPSPRNGWVLDACQRPFWLESPSKAESRKRYGVDETAGWMSTPPVWGSSGVGINAASRWCLTSVGCHVESQRASAPQESLYARHSSKPAK